MSTKKPGNQNTAKHLLSGQLLFGSRKKLSAVHCNKNLNSTATSIKRPRSASCRPKGDFVLFCFLPFCLVPQSGLLIEV